MTLLVGSIYKPETHIGKLLFVGRDSSFKKAPISSYDLSILGNPFPMEGKEDRDNACNKYKKWLEESYQSNPQIFKIINKLVKCYGSEKQYTLLCFCYPKRCHANEIINFILSILSHNSKI